MGAVNVVFTEHDKESGHADREDAAKSGTRSGT